jgi:hypothetical protein
MKTKDLVGGKYIKAETDLIVNNRPAQMHVQISDVTLEEIGDDRKYVLHFSNSDKSLILNKTNTSTLLGLYPAAETDEWIGSWVTLTAVETEYAGKRVWGTRIALTVPDAAAQASAAPDISEEITEINF